MISYENRLYCGIPSDDATSEAKPLLRRPTPRTATSLEAKDQLNQLARYPLQSAFRPARRRTCTSTPCQCATLLANSSTSPLFIVLLASAAAGEGLLPSHALLAGFALRGLARHSYSLFLPSLVALSPCCFAALVLRSNLAVLRKIFKVAPSQEFQQ